MGKWFLAVISNNFMDAVTCTIERCMTWMPRSIRHLLCE
ncbi:hypothetical protein M7I_7389 [Glarea lozoyensis 74030]|uniref:Uncharacterized protein n=1 Tax=Glarea lozoyensis (strain ATCC 74030 / MF5533) TaxID=1104152 RepID=H0EX62_GLAL7|nr:hypothetical protein M7I_7389 [Glarea lozoyensis 74030]